MSRATPLSRAVRVREHYLRSAHLEHHSGETASSYIPTARALDVLHRITRSMGRTDTGRSWSLTGPYGCGKSSFALFLHALLGPDRDATRLTAEQRLLDADPALAERLDAARRTIAGDMRGFVRATVTAQREPVVSTVIRALEAGARDRWQRRMPEEVRTALRIAAQEQTAGAVLQAVAQICKHAPLLLAIDEFGKNLEHVATDPASADLFLLQELAERATGRRGLPLFVLTLQHLAFDDYVRGAGVVLRGEWGKVQGRFEDVPFVETAEQSLRLVAGAFDATDAPRGFATARSAWAKKEHAACQRLGLARVIPGGEPSLEACYPLHPLTLLALPEMCARFGQNGRTLFSFLTSREPHSVADYLETTPLSAQLPSVPLDRLYDFFLAAGAATATRHGARLAEIDQTLRETTGLSAEEARILKVIGVLNLLSQGGPLRASAAMLGYALGEQGLTGRQLRGALDALSTRGVITYRSFADEYRIWQGSDLDLAALVGLAREEQATTTAAELLSTHGELAPIVAGRHSQQVNTLRYFQTCFADPASGPIQRPSTDDDPDGLLVYFLGPPAAATELVITDGDKPVVIATTDDHAGITEAILELSAVRSSLERSDVQADRVARRELQDRAADARRRLDRVLADALRPDNPAVTLHLVGSSSPLPTGRTLGSLLSDVCDRVYSVSPAIRNEMIARRELTSQGAKARRELLTAMVDAADLPDLGLSGYGPEKAMYAALLRHTGIHRADPNGRYGYHPPTGDTALRDVWARMSCRIDRASETPLTLDEIYRLLMAPPIGLKDGPIPVLLAALLLHRQEDVALYQDGTYQPRLSAELLERLVKTPERFAVKCVALSPARSRVVAAVRAALPGPQRTAVRNATVLSVAGPLLTAVRALPAYTLRTARLGPRALAVREALLTAREPDEMLFHALPIACELAPFRADARGRSEDAETFATRLRGALKELAGAYPALVARCTTHLARHLTLPEALPELRAALRTSAAAVAGSLLEPRLRSFTLLATDTELDDEAWLEALLNNLAGKPAATWRDEDRDRFDSESAGITGQFSRVLALHYDHRAARHDGFDAHRVSVTSPDGSEQSSVVYVDHADRPLLDAAADSALREATELLGPRGGEALLAVLAARILEPTAVMTADTERAPASLKRTRHA